MPRDADSPSRRSTPTTRHIDCLNGEHAVLPQMLSYAQNAEDVVLRRVFVDVEQGFYVDVGASSPVDDSVTFYFYERGWHGVNVDPDPDAYEELVAARARDVNVHAAVGPGTEHLAFYPNEIRGHGTIDAQLASSRRGGPSLEVPQISLARIFQEYAPSDGVDLLKIDVEGWEAQVLASADWDRTRPRVVVVEAVNAQGSATHQAWEPRLLEAGYGFGLFDGINRFYYRKEDEERLLPRLAAPANVLDNWLPAREVADREALEARLEGLETRLKGLEVALKQEQRAHEETLTALEAVRHAHTETREVLTAVYDSTSWRVTSPMRDASRLVKLMRRRGITA